MKFKGLNINSVFHKGVPISEIRQKGVLLWGGSPDEEFPFEIDADTSFLIKNETTLEEREFTYAEVVDGTYDTWLNGANGGVLEWRTNGNILSAGHTNYMRLVSNSGNPYLNDWDQQANLGQIEPIDMTQDWIITLILDKELNGGNQRLNLGVRGDGSNIFGLQLGIDGQGYIVIDRLTASTGLPDYTFNYPYTDDFKLFTFYRIGGSIGMMIDNTENTLTPGGTFYIVTKEVSENSIVLGSRSYLTLSPGKITNYQHLKILTGNLLGVNISDYNQEIMTKYGLL